MSEKIIDKPENFIMKKLTIAVDTMGGDHGPGVAVKGACAAINEYPFLEILLIGPQKLLEAEFTTIPKPSRIKLIHAPDVITPDESPTLAFRRKKESTIVVGLKLVKESIANGFVSAGSTGALLTGATVVIGRKQGIERPVLCTQLPNAKRKYTLLADSGANTDCKPSYFVQFAELSAEYAEKVLKNKNPTVGLVNVGAEENKGNEVVKEAYTLLKNSGLNFIGNIEGRELINGNVDIVVCDGFTGNIVLKLLEGFPRTMFGMIREEFMSSFTSMLGARLSKSAFMRLRKRFDYREVGGAPFLGLKSMVIKAHGSSDELAFKNAIKQCVLYEE